MSEDRTPVCLAPLPKRGPGALGMHAVPAHAHPWWVRHGEGRNEKEVKKLQRKEKKDERKS